MNLLIIICFVVFSAFNLNAQDFRGENRVFLKFETKDNETIEYESTKLTIQLNQEQNEFTFSVDLQSFIPVDNSATMTMFSEIFKQEYYSDLAYKAEFPTMVFENQSSRSHEFQMNGILWIGALKTDHPFRVEMKLLDRFLFLDFDLVTELSKMGIEIPALYAQKLSGKVHVQVVNGKLTEGFK
jgi:hypothetical protein